MKKKILCTILAVATTLCGCSYSGELNIGKNETTYTEEVKFSEEEYEELLDKDLDGLDSLTKKTVDGVTYYVSKSEETIDTKDLKYGEQEGLLNLCKGVSDNNFVWVMKDPYSGISPDFDDLKITVSLPFDVKYTNGILIDSNTVEFSNTEENTFFATANDAQAGSDLQFRLCGYVGFNDEEYYAKPVTIKNNAILGEKDLKFTKKVSGGMFATPKWIEGYSKDSFITIAKYTVKGKSSEFNPYCELAIQNVDGLRKITARLASGKSATLKFYVDTHKPTVSVKSGKLRVSDKKYDGYASGIKSIKKNGKTAKNGCSVKKGDKIIVTDKAGNVTKKTVKQGGNFVIKHIDNVNDYVLGFGEGWG